MNYSKILKINYGGKPWSCGETYESLIWYDKTDPKPTQEHLQSLWNDVLKEHMRQERNQLLKDCDSRVLSDYPNTNKVAWITYRHNLRTLPETWTESNPAFPIKPE